MKMTKFQALYVLWLRNENFQGCSWRALAGNYYARYTHDNKLITIKNRYPYNGIGGNQIDGMIIEEKAWRVLRPNPLIMETPDLFENDLTLIDANLKRHLKQLTNG